MRLNINYTRDFTSKTNFIKVILHDKQGREVVNYGYLDEPTKENLESEINRISQNAVHNASRQDYEFGETIDVTVEFYFLLLGSVKEFEFFDNPNAKTIIRRRFFKVDENHPWILMACRNKRFNVMKSIVNSEYPNAQWK